MNISEQKAILENKIKAQPRKLHASKICMHMVMYIYIPQILLLVYLLVSNAKAGLYGKTRVFE